MMQEQDSQNARKPRTPEMTASFLSRYAKRKLRQAGIPLVSPEQGGIGRRQFLQSAAAAGAVAAFTPKSGNAHALRQEVKTLFFNFSDHPSVGNGRFYACIAGRIHPLAPTRTSAALLQARQTNAFLRTLPLGAVTHVLENVAMPADSVSLNYTIADTDAATGTWSIPHVFFHVPQRSLARAFQHTETDPTACKPLTALSAKREFYGAAPALTVQDLLDESLLIDNNEHASALTMLHPDVLSVDSNSAAHVKTKFVDTSAATKALGKKLSVLGAATPAEAQGPDGPGWATMTPVMDDNGQPLKYPADPNNPLSGLTVYETVLNPDLGSFLSNSTGEASTGVKNCANLGVDISEGIPNAGDLQGKLWSIHDGVTSVNQDVLNINAVQDQSGLNLTLVKVNDSSGYILSGSSSATGSGLVNIDLKATNSFARWLAIYITFYDEKGAVISLPDVPKGISANTILDITGTNRVYLGVISPQFTLFGAPVQDSALAISFTWPAGASSANIVTSGLGGSGSHFDANTEVIGIVMTTLFCFVIPAFLLAFGFVGIPGTLQNIIIKLTAATVLNALLPDLFDLFNLANGDKMALFTIFWRAMVKVGIALTFTGFKVFMMDWGVALLALALEETALFGAGPIAGLIVQVIASTAIAADLARSTHDVVVAPWTYQTTVTPTHDIIVNIAHDPGNDRFPETATHYIVTAIFDDGMPHAQPLQIMQSPPVATLPPAVFKSVPLGGKVNILVAFYGDSGWQAGQGQTGLLDNLLGTFQNPPIITITQNKVPIGPATQYQHQSKTVLDGQGNRVWLATRTGPAEQDAGACGNAPGQLCSFRKITVREGTSTVPGNIGYAWGAYSSKVSDCSSSGGQGQLDQMANIGTFHPQSQYAASACGLNPGVRLTYNLQGNPTANYYLESNSNLLRQIQLDPAAFADPRQGQAWGKLNLDSTDLLLHPGGKLVSVNAADSKLESLRIATAAVTDQEAGVRFTAELYSGRGTRPGLMNTPAAAAITADGVVLVLESGNSRLHALDTCANPVPLFSKQPKQYFLTLTETDSDNFEYLDMAVEYSGYIYVLTRNLNSRQYRLDLYHPNQGETNAISTTLEVNAARIAVDLWRNLYTLNYEVLKMPDGSIPGITEPSVSLWTPSAPGAKALPGPFAKLTSPPLFSAPRPLRRRQLLGSLARPWCRVT